EAMDDPRYGKAAREFFPKINGLPVVVGPTLFAASMLLNTDFTRANTTSLWTYGDTLSWTKGQHAFKVGGEYRQDKSLGVSNLNFIPHATGGTSSVVPAIDFQPRLSGLLTTNNTNMQNVLSFLSGSIGNINQLYFLQDAQHLDKYADIRTVPQ